MRMNVIMGWSRKSEHSVIENVMVHISAATRNMAAWSNSMNENITGYSCQDTDVENGLDDMGLGKDKLGRCERVVWTYIHYQT